MGSADPNARLEWTLTTNANARCVRQIIGASDWINVGQHVVARPRHGKVSFRESATWIDGFSASSGE